MANEDDEPIKKGPFIDGAMSTTSLRKASEELKAKIAKARARSDMPLDSTLGNPNWDANAADGHLDVAGDDEDS
jgi:hypothetical protein